MTWGRRDPEVTIRERAEQMKAQQDYDKKCGPVTVRRVEPRRKKEEDRPD